jgi:beta-mannosidase
VDYFYRPKPAYFVAKRALAPYTVEMKRKKVTIYKNPRSALFEEHEKVEIWGSNLTFDEKKVELRVDAVEHLTGKSVYSKALWVTLKANQCTELLEVEVPGVDHAPGAAVVFQARLVDNASDAVLSRSQNYPEP